MQFFCCYLCICTRFIVEQFYTSSAFMVVFDSKLGLVLFIFYVFMTSFLGKMEMLTQNQFLTKLISFFGVIQKRITVDT